MYLYEVMVATRFQRMGLGTHLMRLVEDMVRDSISLWYGVTEARLGAGALGSRANVERPRRAVISRTSFGWE